MTYYTVYKITNKIDGKYYIGKHKTSDLNDGYMGSGKLLKRAIKKYGIENFTKEILFIFQTEQEMNDKEKELVVVSEETYNLCSGGHGGFDYINNNELVNRKLNRVICNKILKEKYDVINPSQLLKNRQSASKRFMHMHKTGILKPIPPNWIGKKQKEETKTKISISQSGILNSQYGTCWITNGLDNKKIQKTDINMWLEIGYKKGRTIMR